MQDKIIRQEARENPHEFCHVFHDAFLSGLVIPFTTAGRKTDTSFEYYISGQYLHTCSTVNIHLIALKFSEGFFYGLIFLGENHN